MFVDKDLKKKSWMKVVAYQQGIQGWRRKCKQVVHLHIIICWGCHFSNVLGFCFIYMEVMLPWVHE